MFIFCYNELNLYKFSVIVSLSVIQAPIFLSNNTIFLLTNRYSTNILEDLNLYIHKA